MKTNKELLIKFENNDGIHEAIAYRKFNASYQAYFKGNKILIPFDKVIDIKETTIENDVYIEY